MARVLIVDDEEAVRDALARRLHRDGYEVAVAVDAADAERTIGAAAVPFDVVVTDMSMEESDSGLAVLKEALTHDVFTEVIVLTAYGNVANAVESMRRGAFDYLEKNVPGVDVYELLSLKTEQAMERRRSALSTVRRLDEFAARHRT